MQREPQRELERICTFLGYEPQPRWVPELARQNASEERLRLGSVGRKLFDNETLIRVRRSLLPQRVRDAAKALLRVSGHPELSEALLTRVKLRFDYDLAQLGRELGMPSLSCAKFSETVSTRNLMWGAAHEQPTRVATVEPSRRLPLGLWTLDPRML
jgi:hypothetical protein